MPPGARPPVDGIAWALVVCELAVGILGRGICEIQLHTLSPQKQLAEGHAVHRVATPHLRHHKAEELEALAAAET